MTLAHYSHHIFENLLLGYIQPSYGHPVHLPIQARLHAGRLVSQPGQPSDQPSGNWRTAQLDAGFGQGM